jgi:hypothetical protein
MGKGKGLGATVKGLVKVRFGPTSPILLFVAGFALGWIFAPSRSSFEAHSHFSDFFATAAAVIATLFVGYSLGARLYLSSVGIGIIALVLVAVAEIAAVAALSPSLPPPAYAPLMGLTIGGGLGALAAALLSAARVLVKEHNERTGKTAGALSKPQSGAGGPP